MFQAAEKQKNTKPMSPTAFLRARIHKITIEWVGPLYKATFGQNWFFREIRKTTTELVELQLWSNKTLTRYVFGHVQYLILLHSSWFIPSIIITSPGKNSSPIWTSLSELLENYSLQGLKLAHVWRKLNSNLKSEITWMNLGFDKCIWMNPTDWKSVNHLHTKRQKC